MPLLHSRALFPRVSHASFNAQTRWSRLGVVKVVIVEPQSARGLMRGAEATVWSLITKVVGLRANHDGAENNSAHNPVVMTCSSSIHTPLPTLSVTAVQIFLHMLPSGIAIDNRHGGIMTRSNDGETEVRYDTANTADVQFCFVFRHGIVTLMAEDTEPQAPLARDRATETAIASERRAENPIPAAIELAHWRPPEPWSRPFTGEKGPIGSGCVRGVPVLHLSGPQNSRQSIAEHSPGYRPETDGPPRLGSTLRATALHRLQVRR